MGSGAWKAVLGLRSHHSEQLRRHSSDWHPPAAAGHCHGLGNHPGCRLSCMSVPSAPQAEQTCPELRPEHGMLQSGPKDRKGANGVTKNPSS